MDVELVEEALALLVDLTTKEHTQRRRVVTACMKAGVVRVLFEMAQLHNQEIDKQVERVRSGIRQVLAVEALPDVQPRPLPPPPLPPPPPPKRGAPHAPPPPPPPPRATPHAPPPPPPPQKGSSAQTAMQKKPPPPVPQQDPRFKPAVKTKGFFWDKYVLRM